METGQETTLAKVRLHWGIFIPVLLCAFGLIIAALPFLFMFHVLFNSLSQLGMRFNQSSTMPSLTPILLLVSVPYLLIVVGLFLGTWFSYSKSEVTLTNRRLVFRTGLLSRRSGELPLENVESIYISEPLLGRVCGYGTVKVTTVGGANVSLAFIGSSQSLHATLQKAVSNAKNSVRGIPKPTQDDGSRYMPKA